LDEDGARSDSGFDDNGPFRVTPEAGGVSLESALRDYGPAAIDDLIPRLRAIAHDLDAAHASGRVHGALHPSKVIVHDDATSLIAGSVAITPYAAPETADGTATPASDQYAFAALAYEWLFGRPITHAADRPVEVRSMPGVDRVTLSKAFTRALAPNPRDRFASCTDFCSAIANAVVPELPFDSKREGAFLAQDRPLLALDAEDDQDDPVGPFTAEPVDEPAAFDPEREQTLLAHGRPSVDDIRMVEDVPLFAAATVRSDRNDAFPAQHNQPDLDIIAPPTVAPPAASIPAPVASWNPSSAAPARDAQKFGGLALILAAIVGSVFGFAAGYMARPRALQSGQAQTIATPAEAQAPIAGAENVESAQAARGAQGAPRPSASQPAPEPRAPSAPRASSNAGRLLVRSTPSGASVSVDGVAKGVTPLALRELANGTINVTVARRGYLPETRRVVITSARPARSLDVRLTAEAAAPPASAATGRSRATTPGRPAPPAAATTTGTLNIDSRPSGAAVTINGQPRGNTPLTIDDLSPGEYQILMAMPGYRTFTTTVRVVAGERVRAAASLTALEQQ